MAQETQKHVRLWPRDQVAGWESHCFSLTLNLLKKVEPWLLWNQRAISAKKNSYWPLLIEKCVSIIFLHHSISFLIVQSSLHEPIRIWQLICDLLNPTRYKLRKKTPGQLMFSPPPLLLPTVKRTSNSDKIWYTAYKVIITGNYLESRVIKRSMVECQSIALIHNLNWHLYQHPYWYFIDSQLTVKQFLLTHHSMLIDTCGQHCAKCWPTVNQWLIKCQLIYQSRVNVVWTEYQVRCWLRCWSSVNCRSIKDITQHSTTNASSTHDPTFISIANCPTGFYQVAQVTLLGTCTYSAFL